MKIQATLLTMALLSNVAEAKDPCKGVNIINDAFTGAQTAEANLQKVGSFTFVGMDVKHTNADTTMNLVVRESGSSKQNLAEGSTIPVLFADGQTTIFTLAKDSNSTSTVLDNGGILTYVYYELNVPTESLQTMADSPIQMMRLPIVATGTTIDWVPNNGLQKKILAAATCMASLKQEPVASSAAPAAE